MTATATNPLYSFRAPDSAKNHPHYDNGYFNHRRQDVVNDTGALNIYPGAFRYLPDETLEVDFGVWEDFPRPEAMRQFFAMTTREGYNVAMGSDWEIVDPITAVAWKIDQAGRLTFGGTSTNTLVLMWRTGEAAAKAQKEKMKLIDQIAMSAEEAQSKYQEKLGPLGAEVRVTMEDENAPTPVRAVAPSGDPHPGRGRR
jgi:hypothetical protein